MRLRALPPLALAALAALLPTGEHRHALELTGARGAIKIANSREGEAILVAHDLAPGETRSGGVTLANRGTDRVRLALVTRHPSGRLAARLTLRLDGDRILAGDGCHDAGELAPGKYRTFRLSATLARGGAEDNEYAGAGATVDTTWRAGGCGPAARLVISHRRVALVRGRALVRVRCIGERGARCGGRLELMPARGRSRIVATRSFARASFALTAPSVRTLTLRVPPQLGRRRKSIATAVIRPGGTRRRITLIETRR